MPALKAASTISVGYDNFDVQALSARGVLLMHTPTVLTDTVADTLMALVLATARWVVESAQRVRAGEWQRSIDENWYGVNVHHKTLGVVCMGHIGMALENRTLFGAGLDVFEQEPLPVTSPLLRLPNVVALPHIGSATHETRYNMVADAVNNLITALTGRVEKNCVNPEILPGH